MELQLINLEKAFRLLINAAKKAETRELNISLPRTYNGAIMIIPNNTHINRQPKGVIPKTLIPNEMSLLPSGG